MTVTINAQNTKWEKVLASLESKIERHVYDGFFSETKLVELNGDEIVIFSPSAPMLNQFLNYQPTYKDILSSIISSVFAKNYQIKIVGDTTTTTSTTTTTTQATSTTTHVISSAHSVDLDGYLGVDFNSVSDHFGDQTQNSGTDEFYGGNVYYFDGMTITTSGNGNIVSMDVDYTKVQNKDTYYFKNITYYSVYDHIIGELGEPNENLMTDPTEPCIRYVLDIGSGQVIQFEFDDNQKVSSFSMFYAD